MKTLKITALVLAVLLFGGFLWIRYDLRNDLSTLEFTDVSVKEIPDGTYEGKSSVGPVKVKAEVQVKDGKIESIRLLRHENGMGKEAEALPWIMERMETWDVDCVTGATISSQAIRQAVNRALLSGLK